MAFDWLTRSRRVRARPIFVWRSDIDCHTDDIGQNIETIYKLKICIQLYIFINASQQEYLLCQNTTQQEYLLCQNKTQQEYLLCQNTTQQETYCAKIIGNPWSALGRLKPVLHFKVVNTRMNTLKS